MAKLLPFGDAREKKVFKERIKKAHEKRSAHHVAARYLRMAKQPKESILAVKAKRNQRYKMARTARNLDRASRAAVVRYRMRELGGRNY